jgi:uncharacterized membrane protein
MVGLTALLWSLTIPLDKLAVERSSAPFHGVVVTAGVAAGVLLVLVAQGRLGDLGQVRRVPGVYVLALVVSSLALALQFLALPQLYVGTVETLKRGSATSRPSSPAGSSSTSRSPRGRSSPWG